MEEKVLGKIDFAEYGTFADRPFLMGLQLGFKMQFGGVGCGGRYTVNMSEECKWDNQEEREHTITLYADKLYELLNQANVNYVSQLKNIPVEITLENHAFKSFRILTEVL